MVSFMSMWQVSAGLAEVAHTRCTPSAGLGGGGAHPAHNPVHTRCPVFEMSASSSRSSFGPHRGRVFSKSRGRGAACPLLLQCDAFSLFPRQATATHSPIATGSLWPPLLPADVSLPGSVASGLGREQRLEQACAQLQGQPPSSSRRDGAACGFPGSFLPQQEVVTKLGCGLLR